MDDNEEEMTKYTSETRAPMNREHHSLPVTSDSRVYEVLDSLSQQLWPLLSRVLQAREMPLLGSGFMTVGPEADVQYLHKDVHHYDRHGKVEGMPKFASQGGGARTVSVQMQLTDTARSGQAENGGGSDDLDGGSEGGSGGSGGSLEVLPGSHRPDAVNGHPDKIKRGIQDSSGVIPIAVPSGTITIYSSRLWHRGGENGGDDTRKFCFITVAEPKSPAPPGLIHTMEMEDVGQWTFSEKGLL